MSEKNDGLMWALVKEKPEEGLWMKRVPIPEVGPNDVKIKIHKTAICGTDVHIWQWNDWAQHTIPIGLTAGHEYVGEVVEVGSGVKGFQIGDLVSGEGHITCGKCRNCLEGHKENCKDAKGVGVNRNGAFAEYLVIPASNVWPCNPNIPEEMYAIFDPFGNATHTALSYDVLGEDVLVAGAGPIGIMAAAIVKFAGARHVVVTDFNEYRLELAKKLGATRVVNLGKEKLPDVMAVVGQYVTQIIISYIIPSGSGQASSTIPLMAPLADLTGLTRQTAVEVYIISDALSNPFTPTSGNIHAGLAMAGIPYATWVKFWWKFLAIEYVVGLGLVIASDVMAIGPF